MIKILAVSAAVLILSGSACTTTRDVYNDPERARTSQAAKEPCNDPVEIPDKDLSEDETLYLWGLDRAELGDCGGKNRVLVKANTVLERK